MYCDEYVYNALYSIAFGTYTKRAEPIDMLFDMMSDPANSVLRGLTIPEGKEATWGNMCPTSLTLFITATSATKDRFRLKLFI